MSFESSLIHTVRISTPEQDDDEDSANRYGDPAYDWEPDFTEGPDIAALVQQDDSEELTVGQDTRITKYLVFLPAGTAINALSRVQWKGVEHEIDGDPERLDGATGEHHVEAYMKVVNG
jgi:hypothetical protein